MALTRYLSPSSIGRAFRLFNTWRRMPSQLRSQKFGELLNSLDEPAKKGTTPRFDASNPDSLLEEYHDLVVLFVHRAQLHMDNRCLPRSLSLYHCLRRDGVRVELVFGVRPSAEIEEGHAWLELDGHPVLEPEHRLEGFVPIFRHPEPAEPTDAGAGGSQPARSRPQQGEGR